MFDYVIVGCGLSGCVIARYLAEKNNRVLIIEKRNHIAGNIYDYKDENGILVQQYGPHVFHTDNIKIWEYVNQYAEWEQFDLECMVYMKGKFTPSPFNYRTIDDYFSMEEAEKIKQNLEAEYQWEKKVTIVDMLNSTNPFVKKYAKFLFDHDYSLYTAKQWGIRPHEIDVSVLKRVPVLLSYETGYFDSKFQAMPKKGYTALIQNLIDHKNIVLELNVNAMERLALDEERKLLLYQGEAIPIIWTGTLDELFHYRYGKLPYRSLRFDWRCIQTDSYQEAPVVAYPEAEGYTRITEYKKLPMQNVNGKTTIAIEYPVKVEKNSDAEPYYPIPNAENLCMYENYRAQIDQYTNVKICGRLAEYKYYDMDQIVNSALLICQQI